MTLDDAGRESTRHERQSAATASTRSSWVLLGVVWLIFVIVLVALGVAWQVTGAITVVSVEAILFVAWLPITLVGALFLEARYS